MSAHWRDGAARGQAPRTAGKVKWLLLTWVDPFISKHAAWALLPHAENGHLLYTLVLPVWDPPRTHTVGCTAGTTGSGGSSRRAEELVEGLRCVFDAPLERRIGTHTQSTLLFLHTRSVQPALQRDNDRLHLFEARAASAQIAEPSGIDRGLGWSAAAGLNDRPHGPKQQKQRIERRDGTVVVGRVDEQADEGPQRGAQRHRVGLAGTRAQRGLGEPAQHGCGNPRIAGIQRNARHGRNIALTP